MFDSIEVAIEAIRNGEMIIVVDDEDRENEGDLLMAAEYATPNAINFMATYGRGLICMPMEEERVKSLDIPMMIRNNTDPKETAFTVSVDYVNSKTGISAFERAETILKLVDESSRAEDFTRPGHIFPLVSKNGGVLKRAGHTEAAVDLSVLAGLRPAGVICEIMNEDGSMARVPELLKFCEKHNLKIASVSKLVEHRLQRESQIKRLDPINLPTDYGEFTLIGYESITSAEPHLALCKGGVGRLDDNGKSIEHDEPLLVRVHSECMTGDLFHSQRCECGYQLITAMKMIEEAGKGALIYLRQEGRGIGLSNKLRAYKLQEQGFDTVDANLELGFMADKRDYGIGAQICRDLGLRKIRILTNNPKKINRLEVYGIKIVEQIPLKAEPSKHNVNYLKTKKSRLGHLLDED